MEKVNLNDEMKKLEGLYAKQQLDQETPFCVRIDGKKFSSFTRDLKKPFDERLSKAMIATTNFLVEQSQAALGYTQSDEITLVFFKKHKYQGYFMGGRVQKITSILASMATARFNDYIKEKIPEKTNEYAFFDARAWSVPSLDEALKVIIWRQEDAIKNSISMAGYANFKHGELEKKTSVDKIKMLNQLGIDWNSYPEFFKSGTFCKRITIQEELPAELKEFASNKDKTVYERNELYNFNVPRIKLESDVIEKLWSNERVGIAYDVEEKRQNKGKIAY